MSAAERAQVKQAIILLTGYGGWDEAMKILYLLAGKWTIAENKQLDKAINQTNE